MHIKRPKTASYEDSNGASRDLKQIPYPLNTPVNMMLPKKTQNRFQLSFKAKEVPVYIPMEEFLMNDLDIPPEVIHTRLLLRTCIDNENRHTWRSHETNKN